MPLSAAARCTRGVARRERMGALASRGNDPIEASIVFRRFPCGISFPSILTGAVLVAAVPALAQQVGEVGVDWLGNDIIVEAIKDPEVEGVTCHVSYFDRGVVDRLQKGNWFEDPSDSAISCRQTGPIKIGDIDLGEDGEEVFNQGISLIWKQQVVNRIYDKANDTLIYLSHSRQVQDGSAKMSMTTRAAVRPGGGLDERQAAIGR